MVHSHVIVHNITPLMPKCLLDGYSPLSLAFLGLGIHLSHTLCKSCLSVYLVIYIGRSQLALYVHSLALICFQALGLYILLIFYIVLLGLAPFLLYRILQRIRIIVSFCVEVGLGLPLLCIQSRNTLLIGFGNCLPFVIEIISFPICFAIESTFLALCVQSDCIGIYPFSLLFSKHKSYRSFYILLNKLYQKLLYLIFLSQKSLSNLNINQNHNKLYYNPYPTFS